MIFSKKEGEVLKLIGEHYDKVKEAILQFQSAMNNYLEGKKDFDDLSFQTHVKEHEADEIRRKIQLKINEGAFLPFYRSDFIELVEMIDKVAGRCVNVAQMITLENPPISPDIRDRTKELIQTVVDCFSCLEEVIDNLLSDKSRVKASAAKVSQAEQEADSLEWKILRQIFRNEKVELVEKRQLKEMIVNISEIADAVENTSDKCLLIVTKQVN